MAPRIAALAFLVAAAACRTTGVSETTLTTTTTTAPAATTTTTTVSGEETEEPTTTTLPALEALELVPVAEGLSNPVFVGAPVGDPRVFIAEKVGRVRILEDGALRDEPFLDVSGAVRDSGEQGFLGMAFHPEYAENGRFFVHYSDLRGATTVVEYRVSEDPDRIDPESERLLLSLGQPARNHNGGMLTFGPDGYLYLGLGDGGGAGDRFGNGQDPGTLLGTILRIDVDRGDPYAIPPDNPFAGGGGAPEVWAYGLRNPWRFAFDEGLIYIADVGQNAWEEIDVAPADRGGLNYGWPIMEASHCFPPGADCDPEGLVLPAHEYPLYAEGCAVIGGYVYRGEAVPEVAGRYFFGDLCQGWVGSFVYRDGEARDIRRDFTEVGRILSFGTDARGELYVTTGEGTVFRMEAVRG